MARLSVVVAVAAAPGPGLQHVKAAGLPQGRRAVQGRELGHWPPPPGPWGTAGSEPRWAARLLCTLQARGCFAEGSARPCPGAPSSQRSCRLGRPAVDVGAAGSPGSPRLGGARERAVGSRPALSGHATVLRRQQRERWRLGGPPLDQKLKGRREACAYVGVAGTVRLGSKPCLCHPPALCPWTSLRFSICDEEQITSTSGCVWFWGQ